MKLLNCFITSCLLLLSFVLWASDTKPKIEKQPNWVVPVLVNYDDTSLDEEAEDGYSDLLYEKQVSLLQQSTYTRKAMRILSETGVESLSQVSIDYDPSYELIIFHTIQIIRDHKIINQLDPSKLKTIQQEKELSRSIYNGSLTSMLILEDLRKDDIVEYSFTIKGFNPIFKNRYSAFFLTQFDVPIYNMYYRVIVPKGRQISFKNASTEIQPQVSTAGDETTYLWEIKKAKPLAVEKNIPSWYDPYPTIILSEFRSWKEVNDWALELFAPTVTMSQGLLVKINEIKTSHSTDEARVLAAVRFVQDDIRYMGFEMGVNSHKPHSPAQVLQQRFGDCKDKSYLLCQLLRGLGIEAYPVLINTEYKKSIKSWLPLAVAFDHTTVCVVLNGKTFWFDPTIAYQRGGLNDISFPNYQTGLVIKPGTTDLSDIPLQNKGKVATTESFYITSMFSPVRFVVTTSFSGSFADNVRYDFKSNSKKEMLKTYKNFYSPYFKKIEADSISYQDHEQTGVFITKEFYTIQDFWKEEKENQKVLIEPFLINNVIRTPEDKPRKMPYALVYPASYEEEIEIHMPEDWPIDEGKFRFQNPGFEFEYSYSQPANNVVRFHYRYENKSDHIQPSAMKDYFSEIEEANKTIAFELSNDLRIASLSKAMDPDKTPNRIFTTLYVLLGMCALGTYFYKRNSRRDNYWG